MPATAPSSNVGSLPNEPIYVLCSGEWDDSTNAGKGGKGSKRDFKNVWLAELSGKECVRLFICHQDREGDVSAELVDRVYHNSLRKDTVNNTAKQYGKDNKNSIVVTVGNTTTTSLKDKKFADMLELGKNLPELLNGKKLVAVYSAGHGVRGTYRDFDENQKPMGKEKTMVKLRIGRSSPDGKKTVASPLNKEKIEWYRFDRNAIDEKTNLQPSEFVGIFKDFLDDGATIYLYHCYSAYIVSDFSEALNGMNANVVGMSGKSQIGGDKPLRPNNGRGIAGHVLAVSHNTDNP